MSMDVPEMKDLFPTWRLPSAGGNSTEVPLLGEVRGTDNLVVVTADPVTGMVHRSPEFPRPDGRLYFEGTAVLEQEDDAALAIVLSWHARAGRVALPYDYTTVVLRQGPSWSFHDVSEDLGGGFTDVVAGGEVLTIVRHDLGTLRVMQAPHPSGLWETKASMPTALGGNAGLSQNATGDLVLGHGTQDGRLQFWAGPAGESWTLLHEEMAPPAVMQLALFVTGSASLAAEHSFAVRFEKVDLLAEELRSVRVYNIHDGQVQPPVPSPSRSVDVLRHAVRDDGHWTLVLFDDVTPSNGVSIVLGPEDPRECPAQWPGGVRLFQLEDADVWTVGHPEDEQSLLHVRVPPSQCPPEMP